MEQVLECLHCYQGYMVEPDDKHPSYLICNACGAIELTYNPLPYQMEFHETPYQLAEDGSVIPQLIGVFGGYGSAKSRASLQEVFLRALENPGGTGLLSAQTLQQLKRTTLKTLLNEVIPPPLIENYNKTDGEITLVNGFTFYTIPVDDEEKIRSINMGICHLEEASGIKESIYTQLLTRMRDPFVKNKAIFVCSNPSLGWIKNIFVDNEKRKNPMHPEHEDYNPFITTYIWETKLNTYLPPNFSEIVSKGRPAWWIDRFLNGSFQHADGQVYPNFSNCIIEPLPVVEEGKNKTDRFGIPLHWERIIGMDHGLRNPTAVVFAAIDPKNGEVIIYNEYYKPNTLVPEHAKNLKPLINEIPAGLIRFMVADPSIRNKTDPINGKSVQALYQEYGMFFTPGNNAIEAGILKVNSYVERGKLKIYHTCVNTVKEHLNYKFPELDIDDNKNPDEKPVKKDEHSCFVTGTLIETLQGLTPIDQIKIGDRVLTRKGFKPVLASGVTSFNADTYMVKFSNGICLEGTASHPVWLEGKGFVRIDSLRYGDIIEVSPNWEELICQQNSSFTKALNTEGIQTPNLHPIGITSEEQVEKVTCTMKSTKTIMGESQKGITFITKTGTQVIMSRLISKLSQLLHTCPNTVKCLRKRERNTLIKYDHKQKNGTLQKKGMRGTNNMLKDPLLRLIKNLKMSVNNAVSLTHSKLLGKINPVFVPITVNQLGVEPVELMTKKEFAQFAELDFRSINTQKQEHVPVYVVGVVKARQNQTVYNLTVEDCPEYYANGILTHNCDATRYMIHRLPDSPDLLKSIAYEPKMVYNRNDRVENEWHWGREWEDDERYQGDWMGY